jgi:hypothetical protein
MKRSVESGKPLLFETKYYFQFSVQQSLVVSEETAQIARV